MLDLIGGLAAVVSFVLFVPQAVVTWKARKNPTQLQGCSVGTQVLIMLNAILWWAYAWITGSFWVGAPGLVNFPLAVLTAALVLAARRRTADDACALCARGDWHRVFVTAAPGYGSLRPCTPAARRYGQIVTAHDAGPLVRG